MSEDERPDEERGQDELIAAFAALGGPLTDAEFMQVLGSDEYYGMMVRLAVLLLDGAPRRPVPWYGMRPPPCSTPGAAWVIRKGARLPVPGGPGPVAVRPL